MARSPGSFGGRRKKCVHSRSEPTWQFPSLQCDPRTPNTPKNFLLCLNLLPPSSDCSTYKKVRALTFTLNDFERVMLLALRLGAATGEGRALLAVHLRLNVFHDEPNFNRAQQERLYTALYQGVVEGE